MAGIEYGPKIVSPENRRLIEVGRFSGGQLQDIEEKMTPIFRSMPSLSRRGAVLFVTKIEKEANKIHGGLDALNQLSIVGRGAGDVYQVIVRQSENANIERGAGERKPRSGEGGPHYYYEIDWINAPEEKPISIPKTVPAVKAGKPEYPFKTQAQRDAEHALEPAFKAMARYGIGIERRGNAEKRRSEKEKREAEKKERDEIIGVVVDVVRDSMDGALRDDVMKIELDRDGAAIVYYREFRWDEYSVVDRKVGKFQTGGIFGEVKLFRNEYLEYINILAQRAEGKDVAYSPKQLEPEKYEDIYQRAIKARVITRTRGAQGKTTFCFSEDPANLLCFYSKMDLENNLIVDRGRPINPHFAKFLTLKAQGF